MRPPIGSTSRRSLFPAFLGFLVALLVAAPVSLAGAAPDDGGRPIHIGPDLSGLMQFGPHGRTYLVMVVMAQVAVILAAAKLLGWAATKLRMPGVIGELLAGAIVGPYLLGGLMRVPVHGHWVPLFPRPAGPGEWPVNDVVWALSQFASVVLLFVAGLHTNLKQFVRYVGPASLVAVVGLVAPFALGAGTVYVPLFSDLARPGGGGGLLVPALFVGAILAATSIGITARVLGDIDKLDTPEGVTIVGAAVLDDVLCVITLAVVGGIASAGHVSVGAVGLVAGKAVGFWLGLTAVVLVLAGPIERVFTGVKYAGARVALALSLAFLCSAAAEGFGLAFIIGAYSVGLGLSRTDVAHRLMDELRPIADFLVPIFFAALGMLVNWEAMFADWRVVAFGLALTAVAVAGKLFGCGAAARATGFNLRGACRIGLGMMPRGEVALIVAGVGLSQGIVGQNVFAVSIMMTLLTTILAPVLLVPAFARGGSGRARPDEPSASLPSVSATPGLAVPVPADLVQLIVGRLLKESERQGWRVNYDNAGAEIYLLRSGPDAAQVRFDGDTLRVDASDTRQAEFDRLLADVYESIRKDAGPLAARAGGHVGGGPG